MAFANTVIEAGIKSDGTAFERGTWTADGGTTTGTITSGAGTGFPSNTPKIGIIRTFSVSSDSDDTIKPAQDVGDNKLKLTFTANDDGRYYIEGVSVGS